MKRNVSYHLFPVIVVCLLILGPSPARALFPACNITAIQNGNTVTYSTVDPITSQVREDSWTLNEAGQVKGLQVQGGMAAWIVDKGLEQEVHYRIFDPGRGMWRGDFYRVNQGKKNEIYALIVNDGVAAWVTYTLPVNQYEGDREFCYVTYEPDQGIWVLNSELWGPRAIPENIQVQDGVVAYFLFSPYSRIDVLFSIFDPELKQWVKGRFSNSEDIVGINVNIQNATVHFSSYSYNGGQVGYDPDNHVWQPGWNTMPKASFAANPNSGVAPLWVCFWDTSIALNGGNWFWDYGDIGGSTSRSPVHSFNQPGDYVVQQIVAITSGVFQANGTVQALAGNPPSGGISINNGATYASSFNVTLNLHASSDATEMCFYQSPGFIFWGSWQPLAASLPWQLSSLHILGQSPDGVHTVYVKFRNVNKVESQLYQASIIVDTTASAGTLTLNDGATTTSHPKVTMKFSATDNYLVTKMRYTYFNQEDPYYFWPFYWENYQPTTKTLTFSARPGIKKVRVQFMDEAGNISEYSQTITLRRALPFLELLLD